MGCTDTKQQKEKIHSGEAEPVPHNGQNILKDVNQNVQQEPVGIKQKNSKPRRSSSIGQCLHEDKNPHKSEQDTHKQLGDIDGGNITKHQKSLRKKSTKIDIEELENIQQDPSQGIQKQKVKKFRPSNFNTPKKD